MSINIDIINYLLIDLEDLRIRLKVCFGIYARRREEWGENEMLFLLAR